jgi:carbamoyltransferase
VNQIPYRQSADVAGEIADWLAAGKVVGILHGRDEWGPRALGARSILADPRRAEMKDHLNAKIKFREEFRPFAPVVKEEAYRDWFETLGMSESPYMLYTHKALRPGQTAAVTHVDGSSRVQTVSPEQNAYLYRILEAFERRTGVPVLINTSFNLRGEPIVSSPSDALNTFFASGIDYLALEDFVVEKEGGNSAAFPNLEHALAGCL